MPEKPNKVYLKRLCERDYASIKNQILFLEFDDRLSPEEKELLKKIYEKDKTRAERHYRLFA
jgi:hypothetical protein